LPLLVPNPPPPPGFPSVNVTEVTRGGPLTVVNGTGGGPGIWRFQGGTWFNLTAVTSLNRAGTQTSAALPPTAGAYALANPPSGNPNTSGPNPPDYPGPDDDYRIYFPQTNATWSDVALIYTDTNNTPNGGIGPFHPVIYAALGTGAGSVNNGVYWT